MPFSWTRIVALVFFTFALPAVAQAFPRLQLHPVELVGYKGNDLRLRVELPCGATFYGLIARAATKGTLEVAAAVAQDNIVCTLLPKPVEIIADYLATTGFDAIAPMIVDPAKTRIQVAKIQDLRIVGREGSRTKLSAVYEPRCGKAMGTLIRQAEAGRLEIAIAERPDGMSVGACTAQPRSRTISALDVKPKVRVQALRDKPNSLSRAFELRLADVQVGSVRAGQDGVAVTYQRACNEAPVGLVLGTPVKSGTRSIVRVGMLVAHYYNYPCPAAVPAASLAEFSEKGLQLPAQAEISLIKSTGVLKLATPLKMVRRGPSLEVAHLGSCGGESFVVYGRDFRGALAAGILTQAAETVMTGSSSCKLGSGKVSLTQPYIAKSVKQGELAAMRLKGSATR